MKTLALLLACVAAASALSYIPSRCASGYSIRAYCVLPSSACFKYTIYSCGTWFSTKSYAPIMKVYPGEACAEMTESQFRSDCEAKLSARAAEIKTDMDAKEVEYLASVDCNVNAAIEKYRTVVTEYTNIYLQYVYDDAVRAEIIEKMNASIEEYTRKVREMIQLAKASYVASQEKVYQRLLAFHQNIVDLAVERYRAREENIACFITKLDARIDAYVERFRIVISKWNEKRVARYKCLLHTAHGSATWEEELVNNVLNEYSGILNNELEAKADEYRSNLENYKAGLISHYRCSYQIITYSGCLNFNRNSYTHYCGGLGTWWSFTCSRTVPCFRFTNYRISWSKGCEYNNLITCDVDAVNKPIGTVEDEIYGKASAAIAAAKSSFDEFKVKWATDRDAAVAAYGEIVAERHRLLLEAYKATFLCQYGYLCATFTCQIEDYKAQLEERQTDAVVKYEKCLIDRYAAACASFENSFKKYEDKVNDLASRIVSCYSDCVTKRGEKITACSDALNAKRNALQKKLETNLGNAYNLMCQQYVDLLTFYHGEGSTWSEVCVQLHDAYKLKLFDEYDAPLSAFNCYWDDLLPRLVQHYTCSYKCNYNVEFRVYGYCARRWYIVLPSVTCYRYRIQYYTTYCNYRIQYVNGCYVWAA